MNRFIGVAIALCCGLATAPAAGAQFDLTRQLIQIGNDVTAVLNHVNQYTALTDQFIQLDCSAQGMTATASSTPAAGAAVLCSGLNAAGAFGETYRSLASTPTLLETILPARDWRAVLAEADTVSETDIRTVYATGPEAGERAAAAFAVRRAAADRVVVLAHTRTDAARELTSALDAAETAADDLEARSPVTATGLGQTRVAITLARAQLLAALTRHKAYEAGVAAAGASASEVARRGMEAERLARRTALEAEWAADRAAMAASRAGRLESLYGGFPLHPLYGGAGP